MHHQCQLLAALEISFEVQLRPKLRVPRCAAGITPPRVSLYREDADGDSGCSCRALGMCVIGYEGVVPVGCFLQ